MKKDMDFYIAVVRKIHRGDKRNDGKPYFQHLRRIAQSICYLTDNLYLVALSYFHDSLEMHDSMELRDFLKREGLFDDVFQLSKKSFESYMDYIERVAEYPELVIVKICDIIDNLCDNPTKKQKKKYKLALIYLIKKFYS